MSTRGKATQETSFAKGLHVLGAVANNGPMRVDTIAEETELPVSSVYRYARDLVAAGFLESDEGIYRPGERLAQMARVTDWTGHLSQLGLPILIELAHESGETSMLAVRVGRSALVLDRVESSQAMRLSFQRGSLRMLYAGASAKVLLAYAPPTVVDDVLAHSMVKLTQNTPTAVSLRRQLANVRTNGYAVTYGEVDTHAVGVSVPIFHGPAFVCGLSVAGPAHRLDEKRIRRVLSLIQAAGEQLSLTLETTRDRAPLGTRTHRDRRTGRAPPKHTAP